MSTIKKQKEVVGLLCETQEIKGLLFKITCGACPEKYDVFKGNEQVAYVRLRHGWLYVSDPSMNDIWWQIDDTDDVTPQLKGDGIFDSPEERYYFLNKIADVITEKELEYEFK